MSDDPEQRRVLRHFLHRSIDKASEPAIRAQFAVAYAGLCQVEALDRLRTAIERQTEAYKPAAAAVPPDPPEAREFLSSRRRQP